MTAWFLVAAHATGPSHTADTGAPETLCGLVATVTRETDVRDLGGPIEKCGECIRVLQERADEHIELRRPSADDPVVEVCTCAACSGSPIGKAAKAARDAEENTPHVCPGCHAVNAPCAPGCIDAEIEAENERHFDLHEQEEDDENVA